MSSILTESEFLDDLAEWLRRWTANPLGYARAGSNPVVVAFGGFSSLGIDAQNLHKK